MYDSFDNMYQATIGIDFLSKVRTLYSQHPLYVARRCQVDRQSFGEQSVLMLMDLLRPCTWRTGQFDFSCGILPAKSDSAA